MTTRPIKPFLVIPSLDGAGANQVLTRRLDDNCILAVSESGDYAFLGEAELEVFERDPTELPTNRLAELKSKFLVRDPNAAGMRRLLASRLSTKRETILSGPSLHILVPTLRCEHSCQYCQVSRSLEDGGFSMPMDVLSAACDAIFQSPSPTLTVEFQGGDPLLRFDLVRAAIERIAARNRTEQRILRFVVASTLHQLEPAMCAFLKAHNVYLSTSLDGPEALHNRNRPTPTRDAYARTVAGIKMARDLVSPWAVSAIMTASRESLALPEDIVDEYVSLGFSEVFLRPLSRHGFAKRNARSLGYAVKDFQAFYVRAFERVLYWNRQGLPLREVAAAMALNKILSPFDAGYVDLQSPTGAGLAVLVYNYDGYVYPSDEARMLAASGDVSLRLGRVSDDLHALLGSNLQHMLVASSLSRVVPGCRDCVYNAYCGPDPVSSYNEYGSCTAPVQATDHCQRQLWLFDFLFSRLRAGDDWFDELAHQWAQPVAATAFASNA